MSRRLLITGIKTLVLRVERNLIIRKRVLEFSVEPRKTLLEVVALLYNFRLVVGWRQALGSIMVLVVDVLGRRLH